MSCKTGIPDLDEKIEEWIAWDQNETTCNELKRMVVEQKVDELKAILLKRISFGTAGLRGKMAVGYACMNDLVIVQTAQGLLKHLQKEKLDLLKKNGIVVGYDGRYHSRRWAELTAVIFLNGGYPVKLFSQVTPTPFVPFATKKYKCAAGIMVTASHNPKEDNGYKVYADNSAQIIAPTDKNIQDSILQNLVPLKTSWDTSVLTQSCLLKDPFQEILDDYLKTISEDILSDHKKLNEAVGMTFTYTAMHGVGYFTFQKLCDLIGIKIVPVPEQRDPDPEFPTVKFPNPEEGKSSLDLSFRTANSINSVVILANDPDADRMAIAEKHPNTGEWKVFTGNELGALFGWWLLDCFKLKYPDEPISNVCMLCSTVSSMILRSMSKKEGFTFFDTLTGFKWLANLTLKLEEDNKKVVFAFEEAIGFMCGTRVLDKDGVSAAAHFATMTSYLYSKGQTIAGKLDEIYSVYGHHISCNSYYICHDGEKIKAIFNRIRNFTGPNTYPQDILNGKYKITSVRDLTTGYDNNRPDNKAILPVSASSEMITFQFSNGLVCTLRTSGTEPKIKYYTEICASPSITDKKAIEDTLAEMVDGICQELLQPNENGLITRSTS
ncbi:hypothetical protein NQ315_005093 [Exocentrus adspersus]|uniref:Phosphoglucomutase-2 n=1 Tax=Exocentrus adspersus TaxID=1586481 RepID=A0AAV8VUU5_9CUCU|nr:hypothetical protein NQ315_005093 [Exocentrus adspersus]